MLQSCCRPDLCQSIEKGALPDVGKGLFLLLHRAATPEMAWQMCQGLGFGLVPLFLRAEISNVQPLGYCCDLWSLATGIAGDVNCLFVLLLKSITLQISRGEMQSA